MLLLIFLFAIVVYWVIFLRLGYRLGHIHAILIFLTSHLVGVYMYASRYEQYLPLLYLSAGILMFILGLAVVQHNYSSEDKSPFISYAIPSKLELRSLWIYLFITAGFVIYHYSISGIPLLREDMLIARFDNISSGLFGLPGRFKLFGGYMGIFLVAAYLQLTRHKSYFRPISLFSLTLLLSTTLLAGNKGALLQSMVGIMIVAPYFEKITQITLQFIHIRRGLPKSYLAFFAMLGIVGFLVIVAIQVSRGGSLYSNMSGIEAFFYRTTDVSGRAFFYAVDSFVDIFGFGFGRYFLLDIKDFASLFGFGQGPGYTTVQLLSATMNQRDVFNENVFIVPITPNIFGYVYLEFGLAGILIAGTILGYLVGKLYFLAETRMTLFSRATVFYLQLLLFWVITKGNAGYYLPNMILMLIVFYLTTVASSFIAQVTAVDLRNPLMASSVPGQRHEYV